MKKATIPIMGHYTEAFEVLVRELGYEPVMPPKTTQETIKLGVRHSADMICFPFKATLGNLIQGLDKGAEVVIGVGVTPSEKALETCRFGFYYHVMEKILKRLGYKFDMVYINGGGTNILHVLKKTNPKLTYFKVIKAIRKTWSKIKEIEKREFTFEKKDINIGLVGEAYCLWEHGVNYDIIKKLRKMGVGVHMSLTLSWFLKHQIHITKQDKKLDEEVKKYFPKRIGGHGWESLSNTIWYAKNKFDGVIHLLPLTCLVGETEVITESFLPKPIKEIKVKDKILTHKGRFRKVEKILNRDYEGDIYNISCGGLNNLTITPEHPVLILKREKIKCRDQNNRNLSYICRPNKNSKECYSDGTNCYKKSKMCFKPEFIKVKEVKEGDFVAVPKSKENIKKEYFDYNIKNDKKPKYKDISRLYYDKDILRLLGYYLAEGCLNFDRSKKDKHKKYLSGITFTLNINEKYIVKDIKNIITKNFDASVSEYTHHKKTNAVNLVVYNRSFAYIVEKLCKKYCDKKKIHKDLMLIDPKLQMELVKGFFRGDGCFRDLYGESTYRGVTTSKKLAYQLFWILIRNNIKPALMQQNIKNRKISYMIKISNAKDIEKIKDNTIKVSKRRDNTRYMETEEYFLLPIKKIKKEKFKGKVYNLEIEEDNSYIANNLSVHNCMPETMVETPMNMIGEDYGIPIYRFPIDENRSPAQFDTRLETFITLLKRNKR